MKSIFTETTDPARLRHEYRIALALTMRYLAFMVAFVGLSAVIALFCAIFLLSSPGHPGLSPGAERFLAVVRTVILLASFPYQWWLFRARQGIFGDILDDRPPGPRRYVFARCVLGRGGIRHPVQSGIPVWWAFAWRQSVLAMIFLASFRILLPASFGLISFGLAMAVATWLAFRWLVFGRVWGRHRVFVEDALP